MFLRIAAWWLEVHLVTVDTPRSVAAGLSRSRTCARILWPVAAILLSAVTGLAQQIASADKLPALINALDPSQTGIPMPCSVHIEKPKLDLAFRFQSGYSVQVPSEAYAGEKHQWHIAFRVMPQGGQPFYFVDFADLPASVDGSFNVIASGVFFTGEGKYDVQWTMADDLGRVCRHDWSLDAHRSGTEQNLNVSMPPATVGDFSWHPASPRQSPTTKSRHITILMNAAIPVTKNAQPANSEWPTLMTMASSLLEGLPEADIRLVVFNLDQQQELFSKDSFTAADLSSIEHIGDPVGRWKVDSQVLLNPARMWDLLENLRIREIRQTPIPDTIIFLGVPEAGGRKLPPAPGLGPRFVYLVDRPAVAIGNQPRFIGRVGAEGNLRQIGMANSIIPDVTTQPLDPIAQVVQRMKGKTIVISTPDDLSKAIAGFRHLP